MDDDPPANRSSVDAGDAPESAGERGEHARSSPPSADAKGARVAPRPASVGSKGGSVPPSPASVAPRGGSVPPSPSSLRERGASAGPLGPPVGSKDAPASPLDEPVRAAGASQGETDRPKGVIGEPLGEAREPQRATDASLGDIPRPKEVAHAALGERDAPRDVARKPNDAARAPKGEGAGPKDAVAAPIPLADVRARAGDEGAVPVTRAVFQAFISHADTRRRVLGIAYKRVPRKDAEDVAQDALAEALRAFERSPPARDEVLLDWISIIARRVVADFTIKRNRRRTYEGDLPKEGGRDFDAGENAHLPGPGPHPMAAPSYGAHVDRTLESRRLFRWLEGQVAGHPRDRETLALIIEHGMGKKTYQAIADERGMTLTSLSSRVFEFKQKYVPRYQRERNRALLILLLFLAAGVALLLWLLTRPTPAPHRVERPTMPVLDEILGNPLPVSHPPPPPAHSQRSPRRGRSHAELQTIFADSVIGVAASAFERGQAFFAPSAIAWNLA
jgi:DNA-directed RNA polymerase specialized sigma24 family protein